MVTLTLSQVKLMLSDFILENYGFKGESFIDGYKIVILSVKYKC